jgi:dihydrofolate reductase
MGKIIVSQNITLDGVAQDPTGEEGFRHGGWFEHMSSQDREAWAKAGLDEALRAEALLMGRRSDAWFAARWMERTGVWADRLNTLPKYVVSSSLAEPLWSNSKVLSGDVVTEVSRLKQALDGEILVIGSIQLARSLMENDLVDELRLTVHPIVLGAGDRLFGETSDKRPLRLIDNLTLGDGLAFVTYEVVRDLSARPGM